MTLLCDTEKLSPVSKNKQTNNKNTYTHTQKKGKNWSSYNGITSCCSLSEISILVLCTGDSIIVKERERNNLSLPQIWKMVRFTTDIC